MMQPVPYMAIGELVGDAATVMSSVAGQPPSCAPHVQACGVDVSVQTGTPMAVGAGVNSPEALAQAPQVTPMSLDF